LQKLLLVKVKAVTVDICNVVLQLRTAKTSKLWVFSTGITGASFLMQGEAVPFMDSIHKKNTPDSSERVRPREARPVTSPSPLFWHPLFSLYLGANRIDYLFWAANTSIDSWFVFTLSTRKIWEFAGC
jgi:hypothetical protein